jgi:hypothetical protein
MLVLFRAWTETLRVPVAPPAPADEAPAPPPDLPPAPTPETAS